MIPAGRHRARGVQAALGTTGTGKDQVAVLFDFLDLPGQQLTWYGYFSSEEAFEITAKVLRACGWAGIDLTDLSGIDANEVFVVVEHEPDQNGELRARIKWVNSGGGLAMKNAMDAGQAATFAARMRGKFAAFDKRSGSAPKPASAKPAARNGSTPALEPSAADDDLAF